MEKRGWIYLVCLLLMLIPLGCMKRPMQGKPGGEAPVVISVWYTLEDRNEEELLRQFARINSERSEVIIKGEKVAESKFVERIWKLQAGGEGPEIMIASRSTLHRLYEKGAISPVLVDEESFPSYPAAQAVFSYNQQSFAAPWLGDVPLLYYRTDKVVKPPLSFTDLIEKKNTIALKTMNVGLLGSWWKAEGGNFSSQEIPVLNSPANVMFAQKLFSMQEDGLLSIGAGAQERFYQGDVHYLLSWASDKLMLDRKQVTWNSVAMTSLAGSSGKVILDQMIGIANSSIKTVPAIENAIRLVEEELLSIQTQTAMQKAGGQVPLNLLYYEGTTDSFNTQVDMTLKNAWPMEGLAVDWKLLQLQNTAWDNIVKGAQVESELEKAQSLANKQLAKE